MVLGHKPQYQCVQDVRINLRAGLSQIKVAREVMDLKVQKILDLTSSSSKQPLRPMTLADQEKNIGIMLNVIRLFKKVLLTQENEILINYFELMLEPPALLYAIRMEETELLRFYPALYPPHVEPANQMRYLQIVEQIRVWWEKFDGLWSEWKEVLSITEQKKTVKELKEDLIHFRAGMRFWKRHMHVLVKHTNALLQLSIEASKTPEKDMENKANNEDTYREIVHQSHFTKETLQNLVHLQFDIGLEESSLYNIKKLDGTNFPLWKKQIWYVLMQKKQLKLIKLKEIKPKDMDKEEWNEMDELALSTIMLTLAESIYFNVADKVSAYDAWTKLSCLYRKQSAASQVYWFKKLGYLKMMEGPMSNLLNEFNTIYNQLIAQGVKFDEPMRAMFLLITLPKS
ncbi:hypothetical protein L7F22_000754 [Adiantum nelumboides]|nr:hypothetical protein [Adiantum nelumboides]